MKKSTVPTIATANTFNTYQQPTYTPPPRFVPGVDPARYKAFDLPSRWGNNLHYPDGRIEKITPEIQK